MAKKLFGGLFGGKKKKAEAAVPTDPKGPIVKPLTADSSLLERLKKRPGLGVSAAFGAGDTILGSKLGG